MQSSPLIFADQFLQLSTRVPAGFMYGIGEHRAPLYRNLSQWQRFAIWAHDHWPDVSFFNVFL